MTVGASEQGGLHIGHQARPEQRRGAGRERDGLVGTEDVILDVVIRPQPTVAGPVSLPTQEDGPLPSVGRRDVGGVRCFPRLVAPVSTHRTCSTPSWRGTSDTRSHCNCSYSRFRDSSRTIRTGQR